jgi:hypothetical protein
VIGAVPTQPPVVAVRVCPSTSEPETLGSEVLTGAAEAVTTAVAFDVAWPEPSIFVAVILMRRVSPTSAPATV